MFPYPIFHSSVMKGGGIINDILAWQGVETLVHAGGIPSADFGVVSSAGGGSTFINPAWAMKADCIVRQAKVQVSGVGAGQQWKLKFFRWNGSTFDFVDEATFTPGGTGLQTVTLSKSITVQMGDVPGLYYPSGPVCFTGNVRTKKSRFQTGDITTSDAFQESASGRNVLVDCLAYRPFLCILGDSLAEGHHTANNWHGNMHDIDFVTLPGGTATVEVANQLRGLLGDGATLIYQNYALGSTGFAEVLATYLAKAQAVSPHTLLIHSGVNDVSTSRTWAAVESDLDAIKAAFTATTLLIDEILPWTAGDDTQAATIRTWNANLATWCTANNAILIPSHDAMGQVRVSTGELDDLATAYDYNGVHLTQAGVDALAAIWRNYLR